jgi:hypothetical protein
MGKELSVMILEEHNRDAYTNEKLLLFASGQEKPAGYMATDTDNFQFLDMFP